MINAVIKCAVYDFSANCAEMIGGDSVFENFLSEKA